MVRGVVLRVFVVVLVVLVVRLVKLLTALRPLGRAVGVRVEFVDEMSRFRLLTVILLSKGLETKLSRLL
jgi:hypothetical protein